MNNLLEKYNWVLLISRKAFNGHPPPSYRKALCNLFTISLNSLDEISDDLDAKLNATIQAFHDHNTNEGLAAIDSLQDFVNSNIERNSEQILRIDAQT